MDIVVASEFYKGLVFSRSDQGQNGFIMGRNHREGHFLPVMIVRQTFLIMVKIRSVISVGIEIGQMSPGQMFPERRSQSNDLFFKINISSIGNKKGIWILPPSHCNENLILLCIFIRSQNNYIIIFLRI